MRRGSRKKQHDSSSSSRRGGSGSGSGEFQQHRPIATVPIKRQQPTQDVLQKQRKIHQDEISSLTTKNYRLAKELADLRLRHRDECKNSTRLTMENMNLASRCREAISHVAMLKKELATQQQSTADALASQREQTQRMADSLTTSFISNSSSPDSIDRKSESRNNKSHRVSDEIDNDNDVLRLVCDAPSPGRTSCHIPNNALVDESESEPVRKSSTTMVTSSTRTSSPTEELRDSPASTATESPKFEKELTSNLDEDDTVVDRIKLSASALSESDPTKEKMIDVKAYGKKQQSPVLYSIPKGTESRSSTSPKFHTKSDNEYEIEDNDEVDQTEAASGIGLFPFSASPKTFSRSTSNRGNKSYDDQFPLDVIDQSDSSSGSHGKDSKPKRNMNLMNNIDAFEKSFSTDFPDSFTPKESTNNDSTEGLSKKKIYNPFSTTPEKSKENNNSNISVNSNEDSPNGRINSGERKGGNSYVYSTPTKGKNGNEPFDVQYDPPKISIEDKPLNDVTTKNNKGEPRRPEKIVPSTARARYENVIEPSERTHINALNSTTRIKVQTVHSSQQTSFKSRDKVPISESNSPSALFRRIQEKRQPSNKKPNSVEETAPSESSSIKRNARNSISSIVDAFEPNRGINSKEGDGNVDAINIIKNRRRSVKKPTSYAEPALNTKLRRGDAFFLKTNDQLVQPQVVSPEPTVV